MVRLIRSLGAEPRRWIALVRVGPNDRGIAPGWYTLSDPDRERQLFWHRVQTRGWYPR